MKRAADGAATGEEEAKRRAMEGLQGRPVPPVGGAAAEEERPAEDKQDDELDDFGIPRGWRECPCVGRPVDRFVPLKVPLGARFDAHIAPEQRFSIDAALEAAHAALVKANYLIDTGEVERNEAGQPLADENGRTKRVRVVPPIKLVIDLTRSSRYYDPQNWLDRGVKYVKIPCRGRGQVPQPEAVTDLVFEMYQYLQECPTGVALIHCTHGFNRTGYMIASYLARVHGKSMPRALEMFTKARPPGIYKHYYIRELFKYYHERLPSGFPFPPLPAWKAGDSPEHEEEEEVEGSTWQEDPHVEKHHDDVIGEQVNLPEEVFLRSRVMDAILGPDPFRNRVWLPGSQPVSLDASNKSLLEERPYWVTWKADGTRYMLVLMRWGTYLIDRKFAIRRVQMRWPTALKHGQPSKGPVGPPHHLTILDGEMVVDENMEEERWDRRFLAYDMVMCNGHPLVDRPWMERYKLIESEVIVPRNLEKHKIQTGQWQYHYQYDKEAFHVRRKEFWPLTKAKSLIDKFIPQLSHEADGLIFQATQDPYVPGTCHELLKWKFAHLNSVDFRLRRHPKHGWMLELLETRKGKALPEKARPGYHELKGARVEFPASEDPEMYDMRIIECSWDPEKQVWLFMRERKDKELPNATHVFESVQRSIEDNIKEDELLPYIEQVLQLPLYDKDTGRTQGRAVPPPQ